MAHKKLKAFIMILDKKEAWFYSSSQLKKGPAEHVGMVGGYPNLLLSETLSAQIMF